MPSNAPRARIAAEQSTQYRSTINVMRAPSCLYNSPSPLLRFIGADGIAKIGYITIHRGPSFFAKVGPGDMWKLTLSKTARARHYVSVSSSRINDALALINAYNEHYFGKRKSHSSPDNYVALISLQACNKRVH